MRKLFATFLAVAAMSFSSQAQIVINEVLYTIPGTGEDEEFVEIHNAGSSPVNMMNYTVTVAFSYTFGNVSIPANGYFVIARDTAAFNSSFGMIADAEFDAGTLGNSEIILLHDGGGALVDSVHYKTTAPWPQISIGANTQGRSLQLCNAANDNNDGANWGTNNIQTGINGQTGTDSLYATPGAMNTCVTIIPPGPVTYPLYTFNQINGVDSLGSADSVGVTCELRGIAHCIDMRGTGYDFPFANSNNSAGVRIFSSIDVDNYTHTAGDSLHMWGSIGQFNGLLQFTPDSIAVISQGNAMAMPMVVPTPSEMTENRLITLTGVSVVDTSAWTGTGSGFNVMVTDGVNTSLVRIDNDADLYSQPVPLGTFNLTGWGGQYDTSVPRTDGYQLLPCSMSMITGTTELENNSHQVAIFPNPASTSLTVRSDVEIQAIAIYNTLGQEVITKNNVNTSLTQVNTSNLENGVYVISIVTDKKIMTQQFQVVK